MRVLLTSHGSTGDVFPVIALGKALVEAGHDVRFACVKLFQNEVERAGITFVRMPPDWDQSGFAEAMRELTNAKNPIDLMRIIYSESLPFLEEILGILIAELEDADLFVCSYLFSHMTSLARAQGVPGAVATFSHHVVPSPAYPPDSLPRLLVWPSSIRKFWNCALWRIADAAVCWQINRVVGSCLDRRGISRAKSFLLNPGDKALIMVSPSLFNPGKQLWNDAFVYTGYLRWQSPEDLEIQRKLETFCQGEFVPILNFGSVTFPNARKVMTRFMRNWPQGKKIIIQSGWAGLTIEEPRDCMLCIGSVSHDQLFKYASMVIHHGGAGTTASVLHAGVPQIIIPHIGDQWFFAGEVEKLGVGFGIKRKSWPEKLPVAVGKLYHKKKYAKRAKEVAQILASENGPATAVSELMELVRTASDSK
ncbi:glycosyltransferase [Cerasicoccus frondis]|uniref:glycosyltransferase n=1 Tax=Cerasicoccus frondis TaxID=490090 RepID=UPI002852576A|nr:nucleotide disphospho-sugar-binding domain-containing protein [Cerasicoccus frondis]